MELKLLHLNLGWPEEVALKELRLLIVVKLRAYGDPLRWAITSIRFPKTGDVFRELSIEAVVIIP